MCNHLCVDASSCTGLCLHRCVGGGAGSAPRGWYGLKLAAPWQGAISCSFQAQPWPLWNQIVVLVEEPFLVGGKISSSQIAGEGQGEVILPAAPCCRTSGAGQPKVHYSPQCEVNGSQPHATSLSGAGRGSGCSASPRFSGKLMRLFVRLIVSLEGEEGGDPSPSPHALTLVGKGGHSTPLPLS